MPATTATSPYPAKLAIICHTRKSPANPQPGDSVKSCGTSICYYAKILLLL